MKCFKKKGGETRHQNAVVKKWRKRIEKGILSGVMETAHNRRDGRRRNGGGSRGERKEGRICLGEAPGTSANNLLPKNMGRRNSEFKERRIHATGKRVSSVKSVAIKDVAK